MTPDPIFHITSDAEWQVAQAFRQYRPKRFAEEGFIHCSYKHQVKSVADRLFKGSSDLVLLEIDPSTERIVGFHLPGVGLLISLTLFYLFIRVLPMIAIFEMRMLLPGGGSAQKDSH